MNPILCSVKVCALAESFGGVESSFDPPPLSMTHASMDPTLSKEAGITENPIRLSMRLEDIQDLLDDWGGALNSISTHRDQNSNQN